MRTQRMKKVRYFIHSISVILIVLIMSGCASQEKESISTEEIVTEWIPAGEFSALPFEIQNTAWLYADQADLYYQEIKWNENTKVLINRISKWNMETDQSELIYEVKDPDDQTYQVFADEAGSLYLFGSLSEDGVIQYYLKKISKDGNEVWKAMLDHDTMGSLEGQYINGGAADSKGQICLFDRFGKLYFFNEKGELKKKLDAQTGSMDGMVRVHNGIVIGYLFEREPDKLYESLVIFTVDLESGSIGTEKICTFEGGYDTKNVWAGQDRIYVIADNVLCEINITSGVSKEILSLDEKFVNVEGSQIQALTILKDGRHVVYLYDGMDKISEYAVISYYGRNTLPEKETITIGTTVDYSVKRLEYYVRRFNRTSKRYRVEIMDYFTDRYRGENMVDAFTLDILNGKVPDIIDTTFIPAELRNKAELFENLEPYFEASKMADREDLLESVWRAGSLKDGMYFVMPWFSMRTCAVKKDKLGESRWNLDTLIQLSDAYPDSSLINYITGDRRLVLLYYALEANRDTFYDMESRTCNFMEPEFLSLLEGVKRIRENGPVPPALESNEHVRQFLEDELLVYQDKLDNMTLYQQLNQSFGDAVSWVGYPSSQESYNIFYVHIMLGINSSSGHKDGAWEFIEFLLSADAQKWTDKEFYAFPVRKEGFDHYIKASPLVDRNGSEEYASEEEIKDLYKMAENAHLVPFISHDYVNAIIVEETMAYFKGDRNVKETAETIQNRVSLYLEERGQ